MHLAAAFVLLGPLAAVPACENHLEERVEAAPGGRLELDLDFGEGLRPDPGSLEIVSRAADEVRLVADASGWGSGGVGFRLAREGDTVRIDGGVGGSLSWLFGGPRVRVRISLPREFSADVRCTGGPIRIEDLRGEVRARSEDAAVEVATIEGPVRLRLASGEVRVSEVVGDVDVRLEDGDVELHGVQGDAELRTGSGGLEVAHLSGRLRARTDSGRIELREVQGPVEAKTESGSVFASFGVRPEGLLETRSGSLEVRIPAETGARVEAESASGQVEIAPGLSRDAGGAPLRLYTARGSVVVRAR